jgi:hypothetical protein
MANCLFRRLSFLTITWLVTGLLMVGNLLSNVPSYQSVLTCAEEPLLEVSLDDAKFASQEPDYALHDQVNQKLPSPSWHELQVLFFSPASQSEWSLHFGRGPPSN